MTSWVSDIFGKGSLAFKGLPASYAIAAGFVFAIILAAVWFIHVGTPKRWVKGVTIGIRLLVVLLLLLVLMEPVLRRLEVIPQQSFLVHLFDQSQSMKIRDYDHNPRVDAVRFQAAVNTPSRRKIDHLFRSLEFGFDEKLTLRDSGGKLEAKDGATDLAGALSSLGFQINGLPVSGIVLYTDGNPTVNESRQAIIETASQLQIPIYTVGTAPKEPGQDIWLEKVLHPDEVVAGGETKITALVGARQMRNFAVEVSLLEGSKVIERQTLHPGSDDQVMNAVFSIRPQHVGVLPYRVEVKNDGAESYPWNNTNDFFIRVVKQKRRILYVEGYPRYEYRFLRAAFEKDERFQVKSLIFLTREGHTYRQGIDASEELQNGFPSTEEELFAYDVVVIGDVPANRFSQEQLSVLREFVRKRGGGLLFLAGESSFDPNGFAQTPLAEVLPFQFMQNPKMPQEYRVIPTKLGMERGMFGPYSAASGAQPPWAALPPLKGLYPLYNLKPGAVALCSIETGAGEQNPAVVAYQRYGQGTSLICGISGTWPWRFQTSSDNTSYQAFWKEMTLILVEEAESRIRVEADPPLSSLGSEINLRGAVLNREYKSDPSTRVELEITAPDGRLQKIVPAASQTAEFTFQQRVKPTKAGSYRIMGRAFPQDGSKPLEHETMFMVKDEPPEMREIRLNEGLLREIAGSTGGEYLHLSDYEKLSGLIKPREGSLRKVTERSVWDKTPILAAILGLLVAEWIIRRKGGLA